MSKWQGNLLITGAPLTADDAPNDTEPAAARVFTAPSDQAAVLVQLLDGTSATATTYAYDETEEEWAQVDTGSVNTTRPLELAVTPSKKTFVRLTSVVGSPTGCAVVDFAALPAVLSALLTRASMRIDSATLHADVDQVETKLDTLHTDVAALLAALKVITSSAAITSHDENTITATRGITVGGAGNLVAKFAADSATVTIAVVPGYYPFSVILVHTDTTATGLVAHY